MIDLFSILLDQVSIFDQIRFQFLQRAVPMRDSVLDRFVHFSVCFSETVGLEHRVLLWGNNDNSADERDREYTRQE